MIAAFLILPRYWDFLIFFNKGEKKKITIQDLMNAIMNNELLAEICDIALCLFFCFQKDID